MDGFGVNQELACSNRKVNLRQSPDENPSQCREQVRWTYNGALIAVKWKFS